MLSTWRKLTSTMGRVLFVGAQRLQDSLPQRRQWWRRRIRVNLKRKVQAIVNVNRRETANKTIFLPVCAVGGERQPLATVEGKGRQLRLREGEGGESVGERELALSDLDNRHLLHPLRPSKSGSKQAYFSIRRRDQVCMYLDGQT